MRSHGFVSAPPYPGMAPPGDHGFEGAHQVVAGQRAGDVLGDAVSVDLLVFPQQRDDDDVEDPQLEDLLGENRTLPGPREGDTP